MNDRMNRSGPPPAGRQRDPRTWLLCLLGLTLASCAANHRISLQEFLRMQQAARQVEPEGPGEGEHVPIDVDDYLKPYRIGASDVINVTLLRADAAGVVPDFRARVRRDGEIDLPIVGSVNVADKTLEEVENAIRAAYVPTVYQELVVHVELVEPDTTSVLVMGAVTEPGLIPLRQNERNMLFAIVGAGGASDLASGQATLRRIREPAEERTFDLRDPIQLRQVLAQAPLEDGDIIHVIPAQPNTVYVGGLVNGIGPQSYPVNTEITILQALAAAGGLRTDVFPREGTLIRRMPDGSDVHVKLDLKRLACGDDPNIALAAGDILWVPETWDTRVQDFINRNIFLRAGVSVSYNVTGIEFMNRQAQQGGQFGGRNQENISDPFGFLRRNTALQGIQTSIIP